MCALEIIIETRENSKMLPPFLDKSHFLTHNITWHGYKACT
jgi:hypothetical protein